MSRRLLDVLVSALGLVLLSPVLVTVAAAIWAGDRRNPLYIADRVGLGGRPFAMVKFRSMVPGASRTGVDSTSASDPRITRVGQIIRRCKLDELPQLWNVLQGDMSLVGPRPNVAREVWAYSSQERRLLDARPGITDLASIVFADESAILAGRPDPDLAYNQLIRPAKSRLGLFYISRRTLLTDIEVLALTVRGVLDRPGALQGVARLLRRTGASDELIQLATRQKPLEPAPPPGMQEVVASRRVMLDEV